MKKTIQMQKMVGSFAENKDTAKKIRVESIMPALSRNNEVEIDFSRVDGSTQSFIHALISDPIREYRDTAFDKLIFKGANEDIRAVISIVYRYMQESLSDSGSQD